MTHVMNYTAAASQNENIFMEYMVEVITFFAVAKRQADNDGESEIVYVVIAFRRFACKEPYNEDEAQMKAAAQVPDADYTMIQGCRAA